MSKLRSSPLVYDATYLPDLLIPARKTVGLLREAGARYQADLLLLYSDSCQSFQSSPLFGADKARSHCDVSAVLLDVRTGIVPFSVTASRAVTTKEKDQDLNSEEMQRRVQLEALGDALAEVGDRVVRFLAEAHP